MNIDDVERVRAVVAAIPAGSVLAYGQVAARAGLPGRARLVGRILAEVSGAMSDGTWSRMKACRAEDCRWAFLDTSKNKSRAWCSMESCGNRAKVNAYRQRHQHYPAHPHH